MSHTPGPWNVEYVGAGGSYDNPTDVCEITNGFKRIAEYVDSEDAFLIAAAPDLLKALESLLFASEKHIFGDECKQQRETARAAIKKARGE